jgi:hypothetical protein
LIIYEPGCQPGDRFILLVLELERDLHLGSVGNHLAIIQFEIQLTDLSNPQIIE